MSRQHAWHRHIDSRQVPDDSPAVLAGPCVQRQQQLPTRRQMLLAGAVWLIAWGGAAAAGAQMSCGDGQAARNTCIRPLNKKFGQNRQLTASPARFHPPFRAASYRGVLWISPLTPAVHPAHNSPAQCAARWWWRNVQKAAAHELKLARAGRPQQNAVPPPHTSAVCSTCKAASASPLASRASVPPAEPMPMPGCQDPPRGGG